MSMTEVPRIVSADDHVVEPADVWTGRLPAKYRDVGPRVQRAPVAEMSLRTAECDSFKVVITAISGAAARAAGRRPPPSHLPKVLIPGPFDWPPRTSCLSRNVFALHSPRCLTMQFLS